MNAKIKKVKRLSVSDQVYEILLEKIISEEWGMNEKIPSEIELAEQLGVSRVSLKMALQKMNTLGLTETRIGEGTFVCNFSMRGYFGELLKNNIIGVGYEQVNEFRILIEANVMQLAICKENTNGFDEQVKQLELILQEMVIVLNKNNFEAFHKHHFNFHKHICNMSGNKLFILLYDALGATLFDIYKTNSEKTWKVMGANETINHHRSLLDGIKHRDLEQCLKIEAELLKDKTLK